MKCPSCLAASLKPIKLQPHLPARKCTNCNGILIDLLLYRAWAEKNNQNEDKQIPQLKEVEDSSNAKLCPKCSKIMLKFRIDGSVSNKIDVCTHCDEAWLDEGEWELLAALEIQHQLNSIFTEPWQRNIREDEAQKAYEQGFEELLGTEQYQKLSELKIWINNHAKKDDVIRYLLKQ